MRRSKHMLMFVAVASFLVVGAAAATRSHPQTTDVSATFSTTQTRMHTRTCTEGTNTFRVTNAVWRGTSTSAEPRLTGTLVLSTHSFLNETTGDGWLSGSWRSTNPATRPGSGGSANARLSAVIDNGNHVDGLSTGEVRGPSAHLLGTWSATITGNTLAGELGSNAPVAPLNSALLFRSGCP